MSHSDSTIKIHAFLANQGITSRRKAEALVAEGKVLINNQVATIGQRIDPAVDQVTFNGQLLNEQSKNLQYFLVYKPVGYVSTTSDELGRKNVLDILPTQTTRLYPVGRLDLESEGLLLLTNDGDLAYKMTHPKFEVEKTYQVTLDRDMTEAAFNHLYRGVQLKDGKAIPKKLEFDDTDSLRILSVTVTEGRNRLVRRMLERVGYEVVKLVRTQMGPFSLSDLEGKQYREIKKPEVE